MTATHGGGEDHRPDKDPVYTIKTGFKNDGFSADSIDDIVKPPPLPTTEEDNFASGKVKLPRNEKWRILKNVAAVSAAFMVQFTAFQGTANLQSSINAADGLGTVSLSSIYAALVLSCIFVPTFLIKRLTVKWTLCLSMLCYAPYIGAQFYPAFYTLVPAGVVVGLGAAPMWTSKATYLTQAGSVYAKLTDQAVDGIIVRFFGFFFLAWQTAELWGNLISSLVFSSGVHAGGATHDNSSMLKCGANFCMIGGGHMENRNLHRPPDSEIYEISAIYLACVLVAVLMVALLVDPLSRYGEKQRKADPSKEVTGIQLLSATAYQLKKPNQQLLIPITLWIGMEQAFIGADYTQAYVSCALGIRSIGYVMICFGVVNALCSLLFGTAMKYIGRFPILVMGAALHFSLIIWLLIWKPNPESPTVFFVISGLWGVGDAVWQTQINGIYGVLFRRTKEAAFSNFRLWESAGFVVAYAYSTHLCARMKLYVMMVVLIVGFAGYLIVELLHMRKTRRLKAIAENPVAAAEAAKQPPEEDDEKDEIDDDIIITHL
ncbi:UNC93-like protein [Aricia agestis]|nr:UNC93-like protein [Aricia agestis]XP_041987576.1 UNC93-like protein [Aricia agestis]XP_041987578.1 UNC93-like protein [Aricia agestis]